jgi:hypothetical protein
MGWFGGSTRKSQACGGKKRKGGAKEDNDKRSLRRMEAQYELLGDKIAARKAKQPVAEQEQLPDVPRDDGLTRSTIKYWWPRFGS